MSGESWKNQSNFAVSTSIKNIFVWNAVASVIPLMPNAGCWWLRFSCGFCILFRESSILFGGGYGSKESARNAEILRLCWRLPPGPWEWWGWWKPFPTLQMANSKNPKSEPSLKPAQSQKPKPEKKDLSQILKSASRRGLKPKGQQGLIDFKSPDQDK